MNNNVGDNASYDIGILQDNRYKPGMNTAGNNVQPSASNTWINHNEVIENNNFFSTGFGTVSNTRTAMRQIQFALKLVF